MYPLRESIRFYRACQLTFESDCSLSDALAVFSDGTEITRFASRHGLDSAQVAVLEHEDDLLQAARHLLQMDQPVAALSLLRRCCSHSKDSIAALLTEVLSACWRNATLATLDWEDKLSQKTKKTEALGMILANADAEPYNSSREIEVRVASCYGLLSDPLTGVAVFEAIDVSRNL